MTAKESACSKCKAEMTPLEKTSGVFGGLVMTVTGYLCQNCGHWNDLKRRKAWRQKESVK